MLLSLSVIPPVPDGCRCTGKGAPRKSGWPGKSRSTASRHPSAKSRLIYSGTVARLHKKGRTVNIRQLRQGIDFRAKDKMRIATSKAHHLSIFQNLIKSRQGEIILQASHQATQSTFEPGYQAATELSEAPVLRIGLRLSFFSSGVG